MNKIWLVIKREFLSRVRKKSFLIMTLLGPFLFAGGMIVPLWVGSNAEEEKIIEVLDHTHKFEYNLPEIPGIHFAYFNGTIDKRLSDFSKSDHHALLHIPQGALENPESINLYSKTNTSLQIKLFLDKILSQIISMEKIKSVSGDERILKFLENDFSINYINLSDEATSQSQTTAYLVTALFSAVMILFFIVLYGGQVMRGVIEEKTNRIIEVIISSLSPFQLMMGKIGGIALVSILQFTFWISITFGMAFFIEERYKSSLEMFSNENIETTLQNNSQFDVKQAMEINQLVNAVGSIDFTYILLVFLFYFIFGYLLYGTLFAAIGSVVDSETDTQQFVFPLIAPLMFCMVMATTIINDPNSNLAFWLSLIPFTSPVTMMLRIPFGVPAEELILSMTILLISFFVFTALAAKVYRVGILMYGKKPGLAEIVKWMRYK
jgi:ABC-2 type transport system permease protein